MAVFEMERDEFIRANMDGEDAFRKIAARGVDIADGEELRSAFDDIADEAGWIGDYRSAAYASLLMTRDTEMGWD